MHPQKKRKKEKRMHPQQQEPEIEAESGSERRCCGRKERRMNGEGGGLAGEPLACPQGS